MHIRHVLAGSLSEAERELAYAALGAMPDLAGCEYARRALAIGLTLSAVDADTTYRALIGYRKTAPTISAGAATETLLARFRPQPVDDSEDEELELDSDPVEELDERVVETVLELDPGEPETPED